MWPQNKTLLMLGEGEGGNLSHMENCTGQNLPLSGMEIFYVNQTWFFVTFKFRGQKKLHEWANKCNPNH